MSSFNRKFLLGCASLLLAGSVWAQPGPGMGGGASRVVFAIDGAGDGPYRIDLLSHPGIVTGSRLPVRSIVGQSPVFTCGGGAQMQDVRAEVD